MELTKGEEAALKGEKGETLQLAYRILVATGEATDAERLVPITWAHLSGVNYNTIGDAGEEFLSKLSQDAKVIVKTTLNPMGFDIDKVSKYNLSENFEKLIELPGVGRKTANCVLVYAFDKPAIPVDTHVHRISNRLGLVDTKTPEETEFELMKKIPKKYWLQINDTFVMYGQNICKPISPLCNICQIKTKCNYYKSKNAS